MSAIGCQLLTIGYPLSEEVTLNPRGLALREIWQTNSVVHEKRGRKSDPSVL